LFDPATDTFARLTGRVVEARDGAVAVTLPSGQVLIAGGHIQEGFSTSPPVTSAELFNPAMGTFTKLTGSGQSLSEAREHAVAATLPSGEVLVAGGGRLPASAELFDPTTETFSKLSGPEQSPTERRIYPLAATLPNGHVLIAGGYNAGYLLSAELFNPFAQAEITGGSFGEQTVGKPSAPAVVTVTSVGTQALSISGATLTGANAAAFTVAADACMGATLTFAQKCTISVTFTPGAEGPASAMLTLKDNESEPAVVTLTGMGVAELEKRPGPVPQEPEGEHGAGTQAPQGEKGATEAKGTPQPQGPSAPPARAHQKARAAQVELVICPTTTVKGKRRKHCTPKLLKSEVAIKASVKSASASLSRNGKLYAAGRLTGTHGSLRLVLDPQGRKTLPAGTYTLTLSWKTGKTTHTSRQRITLR
jgi:hypothetical protein